MFECLQLTQLTQDLGLEGQVFHSSKTLHIKQIMVGGEVKITVPAGIIVFMWLFVLVKNVSLNDMEGELMTKFTWGYYHGSLDC